MVRSMSDDTLKELRKEYPNVQKLSIEEFSQYTRKLTKILRKDGPKYDLDLDKTCDKLDTAIESWICSLEKEKEKKLEKYEPGTWRFAVFVATLFTGMLILTWLVVT